MSIKGNFSPSTQVHCYQIKGPSEEEYNDALGADDEEVDTEQDSDSVSWENTF